MSAPDALLDLPAALWPPLLRAVRRAVEQLDRSELPPALRPFATWRPERLIGERPRRAVAEALADDPRLRELVGEALGADLYAAAAEGDPLRLAADCGEALAAAALAARGRWDALAVVAAEAADRAAARQRAGAEAAAAREEERARQARRRSDAGLAAARSERDAARRRAEAAEQRLRREKAARERLEQEVEALRDKVARLQAELEVERREHARRLQRLQRRVDRAERRARRDDDRALRVAAELEALAADLRAALEPDGAEGAVGAGQPGAATAAPGDGGSETGRSAGGDAGAAGAPVPRDVAAAIPGRPARLPGGLAEDDPKAVRALLQVAGLHLVLDGYNLTKDEAGVPGVRLDEQRRWLVAHAAAVAARYGCRVTVVFDGSEVRARDLPRLRGVSIAFTAGEETADDRIVALVGADRVTPTLVVTSDREVAAAVRALGANVTPARAFLTATRA